ncbi:hypothetical protein QBE52_06880 [Clostridiaceae bacterium 35-E11]
MNYWMIGWAILLIILVSIQYSLNKIIMLLKEIKNVLYRLNVKD